MLLILVRTFYKYLSIIVEANLLIGFMKLDTDKLEILFVNFQNHGDIKKVYLNLLVKEYGLLLKEDIKDGVVRND